MVTEDVKGKSVISDLVSFEQLKFKDRDNLEDIFSSYMKEHKYDIELLRDQRLRGHFKERYEHRRNLVDWDYSFGIKDFSKTIHQQEYRGWRMIGVGFMTRLANGTIPNRTLASFIPGKNVSKKS